MANPTAQGDMDCLVKTDGHIRVGQVQDTSGNVLLSSQQANVADAAVNAVTSHTLAAIYNATAANAALDALGTKINSVGTTLNSVIAALEAHGLLADA